MKDQIAKYAARINTLISITVLVVILLFTVLLVQITGLKIFHKNISKNTPTPANLVKTQYWKAPGFESINDEVKKNEIEYGRDLIVHTARYFGPEGNISKVHNGMNCQNCHLDGGTKTFGNNYGAVATTYPKFRARSGTIESVEKRVNDCFERSLNGEPIDVNSKEMKAMVSYINFLGSEVKPDNKPEGIGMMKLDFMDRAADPKNGKLVYETMCATCHGVNGEGKKSENESEYQFPPLWGKHSYNNGAGLYRLSNFAQFIYTNMPLGATFDSPILTKEQAWDIAAYVNSLERPKKDLSKDWPKIESKPVDHPFGPFADPFTEQQHKFGPFKQIVSYQKSKAQ